MDEVVDARGMACPQPVVLTRQALKEARGPFSVLVDNPTARENVARFASSQGCAVEVFEEEGGFRLEITPGTCSREPEESMARGSHLFILSADFMGKVDNPLGRLLIKAFLNTLADRDKLPSHLVLFNSGVLLACGEAETVEPLRRLQERGVTILVCGTCLDFFGVKEELRAGSVSNMYEIIETLTAGRCITI